MSVRSTSVLTKNPIRSSSALSVRPAIGLPIGMSLPAPSRVSSAASPACSTMNRLAPRARESSKSPACSSRRQPNPDAPPAIARHRRPRPPAGKLEPFGKTRQPIAPERQLARNRALRIALRPQNAVLPQRIVGILHRQSRKLRHLPGTPRPIAAPQIARQRRQRPAVGRNVMQHQQQHMLVRSQRKQMRPQRRLARKIKAARRRRRKRLRQLAPRSPQQPQAQGAPATAPAPAGAQPPASPGRSCAGSRAAPTTSQSAASSAATSSAPRSRTASGIV